MSPSFRFTGRVRRFSLASFCLLLGGFALTWTAAQRADSLRRVKTTPPHSYGLSDQPNTNQDVPLMLSGDNNQRPFRWHCPYF